MPMGEYARSSSCTVPLVGRGHALDYAHLVQIRHLQEHVFVCGCDPGDAVGKGLLRSKSMLLFGQEDDIAGS